MQFDGPQMTDYDNVVSLNQAFLTVLKQDSRSHPGLAQLSPDLFGRITELTSKQIERLSTAPFLLLSFREQDERYWNRIFTDAGMRDLFSGERCDDLDTVISAGLGFIWQLARQNPYTLRLICGSSLHWCESLAEQTFYGLLYSVTAEGKVPELRHAHEHKLWANLLDAGVSNRATTRKAAHISALQTVLTRPARQQLEAWPRAARPSGEHGLRVAEERGR